MERRQKCHAEDCEEEAEEGTKCWKIHHKDGSLIILDIHHCHFCRSQASRSSTSLIRTKRRSVRTPRLVLICNGWKSNCDYLFQEDQEKVREDFEIGQIIRDQVKYDADGHNKNVHSNRSSHVRCSSSLAKRLRMTNSGISMRKKTTRMTAMIIPVVQQRMTNEHAKRLARSTVVVVGRNA